MYNIPALTMMRDGLWKNEESMGSREGGLMGGGGGETEGGDRGIYLARSGRGGGAVAPQSTPELPSVPSQAKNESSDDENTVPVGELGWL
jgi:hypothetical protein